MEIKVNEIYTFKLFSGEELVTEVKEIHADHYMISHPVSIAPGQNGVQMIPSAFTLEMDKKARLNINAITMIFVTNDAVITSYMKATTGIDVPSKKILIG